jgi:hypothetical protein
MGVGECGGQHLRGVGVQLAHTKEPGCGWLRGSAEVGPTREGGDRRVNWHSNEDGRGGGDMRFGQCQFTRT